MFRRFPLTYCVLWLLVLLLWGGVISQSELRKQAQNHWQAILVPPSYKYTYESLDSAPLSGTSDSSRCNRIMYAYLNREKARPLLDQYPDDVSLLAAYVLNNQAFYTLKLEGPLLSRYDNWSVQTEDTNTSPSVGSAPPRGQIDQVTDLIQLTQRGQRLESQNIFWNWMQMTALLAANREREIPEVLKRAQHKTLWNDHIRDEMWASAEWSRREVSYSSPAAKVSAYTSTTLPHVSRIYQISRMAAQLVMGLRLQGKNQEALLVATDAVRLLRMVRLQSSEEVTSRVATACEYILFTETLPQLGRKTFAKSTTPISSVIQTPSSLLFLAHRTAPRVARELDGEWINLGTWKHGLDSPPRYELFGGLVKRQTVEGAGWTGRATSYLFNTLPVAVSVCLFLSFFLVSLRSRPTIEVGPQLWWWGSLFGLGLLGLFLAYDWTTLAVALKENADCFAGGGMCDVGTVVPEQIFYTQYSLLSLTPVLWGVVALWLGMLAFVLAFRKSKPKQTPGKTDEHEVAHPLDLVWDGTKWIWISSAKLLSLLAPLWLFGGAVAILFWPAAAEPPFFNPLNLFALALSLGVWPLAVGIRHLAVFRRTRQRTAAPARFLVFWRSFLGGYITVTLLILPILLLAESRFEHEFNSEFAPIEQGQMVRIMQQKRGLSIR